MPEENTRGRRESDMILAPNEFMYVSDQTKGNIDVFVGPTKQSLSGTDSPVIWDESVMRFKPAEFREAIQASKTAPEGWYIVLKNPAPSGKRPSPGGKAGSSELEVGRKVNIPGPVSFPLWPGQMAKVIKGHSLRSNQYLLIRVYDETAAQQNWSTAVIKLASTGSTEGVIGGTTGESSQVTSRETAEELVKASDLTIGKLLVIKGTEISFYIPPTGIEVVPDERGAYVREAVTLERLEYCLLMDENGNKRYEKGPAVVFPEPTEIFKEREVIRDEKTEKTRKFRAIELNENSGIYIKVIAEYTEGARNYKVGEELFITGKEIMIYFPREEHAIIKYDNNEITYGIAIPAGEARYVLDRNSGNISLITGPRMFLPDPRRQVIVKRVLDFRTCSLLYPNNLAALEHNAKLADMDLGSYMSDSTMPSTAAVALGATGPQGTVGLFAANAAVNYSADMLRSERSIGDNAEARGLRARAARGFAGDALQRKNNYSEPRSVTLTTKFDGAVSVNLFTGYAMMVVSKTGERRVEQGPKTVLLGYEETPQILTLSRGKPKSTDDLLRTAYLLVSSNKISDIIYLETRDFCQLEAKVSYRVNFEGNDPNRWFAVENYVKFLCDHMRSKLRNAVQKLGIEEFYGQHSDVMREVILGKSEGDKSAPGTTFEENGMHIYDVEILDIKIKNQDIEKMLVTAQREVISNTLLLQTERRKLEFALESELFKQKAEEALTETKLKVLEFKGSIIEKQLELEIKQLEASAAVEVEKKKNELEVAKAIASIHKVEWDSVLVQREMDIELEGKKVELRARELESQVAAIVEKAKALSPDLIAALQAFGDKELIERLAKAMAPMSILGGESVTEIMGKMLQGSKLAQHLLGNNGTNGSVSQHA